MKRYFTLFLFSAILFLNGVRSQNFTQGSITRTAGLEITVLAKSTTVVPAGSNVLVLFCVSLPGGTGPASLTGVTLIGGTITPQTPEVIAGRKVYPFSLEAPSSSVAISNVLPGTGIAKITFPASEDGDLVQLNDFTGSGGGNGGNGYWYISYSGIDATDYVNKFYGTNPENSEFGDSKVDADSPLPISLVSFKAEKFNVRSSLLKWSTATEINSSHFLVQRSTDKKSWATVGKVNAAGNSQIIENYEFLDQNVFDGISSRLSVYYRLQMVDLDGQMKNSPIENVIFGNDNQKIAFEASVYPNPASEGIHVSWTQIPDVQPSSIQLYDVAGKLVYTEKVGDNTNEIYLDLSSVKIQSGVYVVRLFDGSDALDYKQIVVDQN